MDFAEALRILRALEQEGVRYVLVGERFHLAEEE